jgi:hypothetical protein
MRKRFEPQTESGKLLIEDTPTPKNRDGTVGLLIALRELYKNKVYRNRILEILETKLLKGKHRTGRPGMDLWTMFVLAQIRLSKQLSYDELHTHANYNKLVRQVTGVERESGFAVTTFPYQTIVDNVRGGLSRCPDRGNTHFTRYVARDVCSCNHCCIGRKLQTEYNRKEQHLKRAA